MSANIISRRSLVSGLSTVAATAFGAAAVSEAQPVLAAESSRKFSAQVGPCNLWRGHSIKYQVFVPAVQSNTRQTNNFQLTVHTLDGSVLFTHQVAIPSGQGAEILVEFLADGSVRVNGDIVPGVKFDLLVVIAIIAILIGLLLPAVQSVRATATSFIPTQDIGLQNVNYILPFIEQ